MLGPQAGMRTMQHGRMTIREGRCWGDGIGGRRAVSEDECEEEESQSQRWRWRVDRM